MKLLEKVRNVQAQLDDISRDLLNLSAVLEVERPQSSTQVAPVRRKPGRPKGSVRAGSTAEKIQGLLADGQEYRAMDIAKAVGVPRVGAYLVYMVRNGSVIRTGAGTYRKAGP